MTARWPDPDRANIGRYVASLNLRSMKSRTCYRQVLYGFQDVVERHSKLDQEVLIAWLRISAECWAAMTRLHRTRIIDRFLDHLLKVGAIDRNPAGSKRKQIAGCRAPPCVDKKSELPALVRDGLAVVG